jgi:hypothetical protein
MKIEEARCLLMEEIAKDHCEKSPVCWYDVCVSACYILSLSSDDLEAGCRRYQWTKEDSDKLRNGEYFSPMWLYKGYLQMFNGSLHPIDYKLRWDNHFENERRDIGA